MKRLSKLAWGICGSISLLLGIIGIPLPLLPTVPFLLLAAFCFSRSSKRLHRWLVNHKTWGPLIHQWHTHGAISKGSKSLAMASMVLVFVLAIIMQAPNYALIAQFLMLSCVAFFILTRPSFPAE